jgi:hypothetical protein
MLRADIEPEEVRVRIVAIILVVTTACCSIAILRSGYVQRAESQQYVTSGSGDWPATLPEKVAIAPVDPGRFAHISTRGESAEQNHPIAVGYYHIVGLPHCLPRPDT